MHQHPGQPPASTERSPRRSPILGIFSLVLSWLSGAALYWASSDATSGDLIMMLGPRHDLYNTLRALMIGGLLLGTVLGAVAMATRRGRWWGLAGLVIGGLELVGLLVVVLLIFGLFAIIQVGG